MSLYGHRLINIDSLKRWVNSLNVEEDSDVDVGGFSLKINGATKELLTFQLDGFRNLINNMKEGDDWRTFEGILSPIFYNAFIRVDKSSIKMGDFYECLIEPSNIKTYKKIIKGFDYTDVGAIHLTDAAGQPIASIGEKSDLIWSVFFDYFVNRDNQGSMDHVYPNHERYLSIQLFDVENMSIEQIRARVNEILIHVSITYDMDFKIFKVDSKVKEEGNAPIVRGQYLPIGFEDIPMFYLINANSTTDERYQFLSYYQVIEYFFVRAQNFDFLTNLQTINLLNVNHNDLRKVLCAYKKHDNEREALRLVLKYAIDMPSFKNWINSSQEYINAYCNSVDDKVDLSKPDDKIVNSVAERVYKYRCAIAHAKGDMEEYIAIPAICSETIWTEIPLVRYLAYEVIKKWSGR